MLRNVGIFPEVSVKIWEQPPRADPHPQLFSNLPDYRLLGSFPKLDLSPRQFPLSV